ncbi:MAG: GreA/GreB family elongation factor [Myxococcaceae bacterium]|nr:GreA/GreB family elongation factor [Myxococcaceae bacterium]
MSKAFISEETVEHGPITRGPPTLQPGEVRYITPEGFAALQANLAKAREERAEAMQLPEEERAAALNELDQRIAFYEATIASLTVLSPDDAPEGRVAFGTWVTIEDEEGTETTWRIVGPDEADPRHGRLSVHSPVARALMGRAVGETVEVRRPTGDGELTVMAVRKHP